jgi:hypothetical protein
MKDRAPKALTTARKRVEDLEREVAELRQQLGDKQADQAKNLPTLTKDQDFITDMARFASGILSESYLRQKYRLNEDAWIAMSEDTDLIERIELEKIRRTRSGATKRELAQNHIVKGPEILEKIMSDPRANERHKIDAVKALDALADPGAQRATTDENRVIIHIDFSGDSKLKNPEDILVIDAAIPKREENGSGNAI